jgi:hypothetical protein
MRAAMALLLTLPLVGCEPQSVMEKAGETLEDASDEITDTIGDATDNVEENIEEAVN